MCVWGNDLKFEVYDCGRRGGISINMSDLPCLFSQQGPDYGILNLLLLVYIVLARKHTIYGYFSIEKAAKPLNTLRITHHERTRRICSIRLF